MDDITEQFIRSAGKAFAAMEADNLRDTFARGVSAMFAEQAKAERSQTRDRARSTRLEASMAQWGAMRADAEAKYGPLDVLKERMMARPGMRSQLMMRASFHDWD